MILINVTLPPGSKDNICTYYNLRTKSAYTLVHDEFTEVSTEIPVEFSKSIVEPIIRKYLVEVTDDIEKLESLESPPALDKADILRLKNQLNYLINYEY